MWCHHHHHPLFVFMLILKDTLFTYIYIYILWTVNQVEFTAIYTKWKCHCKNQKSNFTCNFYCCVPVLMLRNMSCTKWSHSAAKQNMTTQEWHLSPPSVQGGGDVVPVGCWRHRVWRRRTWCGGLWWAATCVVTISWTNPENGQQHAAWWCLRTTAKLLADRGWYTHTNNIQNKVK